MCVCVCVCFIYSCFIEYILKQRYEFDFDLHEPNDNKALSHVRRLNISTLRQAKPIK